MMLTAPAVHTLWEVSWHILEGAILLWGPAMFALRYFGVWRGEAMFGKVQDASIFLDNHLKGIWE